MNHYATQPTPGPWHVNDDGEVFGPDFGVGACSRIAKVEARNAIGLSGPHENRLRAEANARLICAAPALLAAARVIQLTPQTRAYLADSDPKALEQLERAIAAAEGQS